MNRYEQPYLATYSGNGSVFVSARPAPTAGNPGPLDIAVMHDVGSWQIHDNRICTTMQNWMDRREICTTFMTDGRSYRQEDNPYTRPALFLDAVPLPQGSWTGM